AVGEIHLLSARLRVRRRVFPVERGAAGDVVIALLEHGSRRIDRPEGRHSFALDVRETIQIPCRLCALQLGNRAHMRAGEVRVACGVGAGKSQRGVEVEATGGGRERALQDAPGSTGKRRGRRGHRPGARAIRGTGVERAEEAQEGTAGATLLALRRRIDDRRLHPCSVLLEDTAHCGVRLAADRGRLALRDELPTCLVGNDGGEIEAVEGLLDALGVLSVLLTLAGAATEVLDFGPSRRDAGGILRALGIGAFRQGGGRKGGEQQRSADTAVHALHGSLLAKITGWLGAGTLGSKGRVSRSTRLSTVGGLWWAGRTELSPAP